MRARLVAAGLGLSLSAPLASAPLASAQSLVGISLGDTEAKVLKTLPGATSTVTDEEPNLRVVFSAKTTVWVCEDAVYSVQNEVGSTLNDYLSLVVAETAKRGQPVTKSAISKVGSARQGWIRSNWSDGASDFAIEIRDTGKVHLVSFNLTGASKC